MCSRSVFLGLPVFDLVFVVTRGLNSLAFDFGLVFLLILGLIIDLGLFALHVWFGLFGLGFLFAGIDGDVVRLFGGWRWLFGLSVWV